MDRLLFRARALPQLSALSEYQLRTLLAHSDSQPEGISPNVILFQRGESLSCWYLLLSGQIQLYLDHGSAVDYNQPSSSISQLKLVVPGTFFGELRNYADATHCCSAKVIQRADFVRIDHRHFMALYNKWAEQLQNCIMPMEDLVAEIEQNVVPNRKVTEEQKRKRLDWTPGKSEGERATGQRKRTPAEGKGSRERHLPRKATAEKLLFKLCSDHSTIDEQITRATSQLREALSGMDIGPISGAELCDRLRVLYAQWLPDFRQPFSALMLQGICQTLLDRVLLVHVRTDHPLFRDSPSSFYRWSPPSCRGGSASPPPSDSLSLPLSLSSSLLLLCLFSADSLFQHILQKPSEDRTPEELELASEELSHIRAFGHLSRSMKQGLARIICCEYHEHAGTVIFREGDPGQSWFVVLRGTLEVKSSGKRHSFLHEGDDFGKLALLNSCEMNGNSQKKQQNNGNRTQRQSTVITAEDGCQLLRVDATKFSRLLSEMETNTVRLKEYMECDNGTTERPLDVLVLQRDAGGGRHSLIAGLPSQILEYTLETRMDHLVTMVDESSVLSRLGPRSSSTNALQPAADSLLLDVLFSLPFWMPSNELCNMLKLYYSFGFSNSIEQNVQTIGGDPSEWSRTANTATKRRTVAFVSAWQMAIGHRFFLDSVANAFVEELFSSLLEDVRTAEETTEAMEFEEMMRQMETLMEFREEFMRKLSRHPRVVLDKGKYADGAPAPDPILPRDLCIQPIHLMNASDHSKRSIILQLRMDKSAAEIAQMAANAFQTRHFVHLSPNGDAHMQKGEQMMAENEQEKGEKRAAGEDDEFVLVEMRPGGGEAATRQFEPRECSVPTMLSPTEADQLFVAHRKELHKLSLPIESPLPLGSVPSLCLQLSPMRIAKAMALHHFKLLAATSASELLVQVVGREHFPPALAPSNLDVLLRRFLLVQSWASTEVLLANPADRLTILQTLIELAELALQQKDLLCLLAITLGLSHLSVARLRSLWAQLPDMCRHQHFRSQFLLTPTRNHRNYRLLAQQLRPPFVPFVPAMVKELSFVHEGRNSRFADGLINFEKMHLIAKVLRSFGWAKGEEQRPTAMEEANPMENAITQMTMGQTRTDEALIRNLHAVNDQRRLMRLSFAIYPQQQKEHL
ncbi:hypothetical protein niasHS_006767 [Heterodera schachtii]|uniref:Uncharacterized protein n=1 Tax=Heterodera schachtii TaxID=97005 RepID=A0ABD2JI80_HETSC